MLAQSTRARLLATTMFGAALYLAPTLASAQVRPDQNAPTQGPTSQSTGSTASADGSAAGSEAPSAVSEVVVTGTRIRSPNLTSNSPLSVTNTQELKFQGTTQVENLLNQLPQFTPDQNQSVSNGSTGVATVNLRGLGSFRNLVLVDGRRLQPGDPRDVSADINNVPSALVDRVEVITGGASAVYGSDAVSGVVNFVLKKNFEGVQVDAQITGYNHQNGNDRFRNIFSRFGGTPPGDRDFDGKTYDTSLLIGANTPDDKGNVTAYFGYRYLEPVTQDSRDFSSCGIATPFSGPGSEFICQGSSNSAFGRFAVSNGPNTLGLPASGGPFVNNPNGSRTFQTYTGAQAFNFGPFNFLQRQDERYTAGAFAHYKINDKVEVYGDLMFTDDQSIAQIAPSGLFRGTGANGSATYGVNCNNPLLSASQATALCGARAGTSTVTQLDIGYRFAGLPRQDDLRHTNYKIDLGVRGDLGSGWNYDVYAQYGTTIYAETYLNDVSVSRVQDALLVGTNAAGQPACLSVINAGSGNCVPLDIFRAQSAGLTPASIGYVVTPGFQRGEVTEQIVSGSITGDLGQYGVKSPFHNDGIGIALGAEYRRQSLDFKTDALFTSGDLSGQGGPTIGNAGAFEVYDLFGEIRIPLLSNLPLVHDLTLVGGYRFSDYSTVGTTNTYKAELSYAPIQDLRFRASYNRAARAPNIVELFAAQSRGLGSFADPCATDFGGVRASLAQCQRTGLTAAQYATIADCPSAQCSILTGGNPNLQPEIADTYTAGFVYQPGYLKGFNISVDYFDITIDGFVGSVPSSTALNNCLSNGDPFFCSLVRRDPASGILYGSQGFVVATNLNTGLLRSRGVDIVANYARPLAEIGYGSFHLPDYGTVNFSYQATYTDELTTKSLPGTQPYNCRGQFGLTCGQPTAAYRHQFRTTWNTPWNLALSARYRYISGSKFDGFSPNPQLNVGAVPSDDPLDAKIGAYGYLDLSATWQIRRNLQLRAGVNNVTDRDPPVIDSNTLGISGPGTFGNANTFPGVYDSLGRQVFVGLTASF